MADKEYPNQINDDLPPVDIYENDDMPIDNEDISYYEDMQSPIQDQVQYSEQENSYNDKDNSLNTDKLQSNTKSEEYSEVPDNIFDTLESDAQELSDLEQSNGINIDNNENQSKEPEDSNINQEVVKEINFKLSDRDYESLDYFASFRGDNLAISNGSEVSQYIKTEALSDKIDSLKDLSQEKKDNLKELVFQESESISGQLGFPKNRLYEEIGDKNFRIEKNLSPDESEIVHDKNNLSEEGKEKKEKNEESKNYDPNEKESPNKNHPAYILQSFYESFKHKRNVHKTKVSEKDMSPIGIREMSVVEQANHFDKINRNMDYIKKEMEDYEKNFDKHKNMKKDFDLNKDSYSPDELKIHQEKIKEMNGNNNKQRVALEKKMENLSVTMDDVANNHDPMSKFDKRSSHDQKTMKKMSSTMKETQKRTKELTDITDRLETKGMLNPKKSSSFNKSLKNIGSKIKDIASKISNALASFSFR